MKPYDAECRGKVLAACDTNEERRAIALRFNVSESWLRRIDRADRETGVAQLSLRKFTQRAVRNASEARPMPRGRRRLLSGTREVVQVAAVRCQSARCQDLGAAGICEK
jgi:hypothetical protein